MHGDVCLRMARIRVLPDSVANQIAAGEVVERPASVVKELIENSLDACARRLSIEIVSGGKRSITVTDDGLGMTEDEALLCLERYATSKVSSVSDLDRIGTFGFRGEALPSIASVSKFELLTRTKEAVAATRIEVVGGTVKKVSSVGGPAGTRISVRNLFFNVPARAKFLKSTATELSRILDIVQRHALANPDIAFRLRHNGKTVVEAPPAENLSGRVALLWGVDFVRHLVPIEFSGPKTRVTGMAGKPSLTRSNRSHQFFFLNRRPVVNRALTGAVTEAYRTLIPSGRFPVAILMLEMDPGEVDVNVHPTKREVRFRQEKTVHDLAAAATREALAQIGARAAEPAVLSKPPEPVAVPESPAAETTVPVRPEPSAERSTRSSTSGGRFVLAAEQPPPEQRQLVETESSRLDGQVPTSRAAGQEKAPGTDDEPRVVPEPFYEAIISSGEAPAQIFNTYLVLPLEERALIIDQHALHERITYEALKNELNNESFARQQLLVPLTVELPPSSAAILEEHLDIFARLGVEIEPFGHNSFAVTSMCSLFSESKIDDLIHRVVEEMSQGDLFRDTDQMWESLLVLSLSACRSSVKAGDPLSPEERRELIAGFRRLTPPYTCPHGRPIVTELTRDDLERSFKRR